MSGPPSTTDAVVIGGGVIGLSTALALSREHLRVRVLERGACGRESSWAGAGVLQCGSWNRGDPLVQLLRGSLQQYEAFTDDLREQTGIDPQYVPCGSFELLLDDQQRRMAASELQAAARHRDAYGRDVLELLSPEAARQLEPAITPELLGVKHCPVTAQVRNPRLMKALHAVCVQRGVQIVEQCAVHGLQRQGERVVGVRTAKGHHASGHVVLAAGAWSSQLGPELQQLMPVYPVRGQVVLLEARNRPVSRVVERGKCYLVPRLDGHTLVGATEEHEAGYEKVNTVEGVGGLLELARRLVPELTGASVVTAWSGLRPGTPDRRPYLGPVPGMPGLWAATGHFRSGLILAPITARIIADLIIRGRSEHDLSRFAPGRELPDAGPA